MIMGTQMFTVRDFCQDSDGIINSLEKIKEIGYSTVQLSGIARMDEEVLKENLDRLGIKPIVTHIPYAAMKNNVKKVAEIHKMLGCKYVGLGAMPWDLDRSKKETFIDFAREFDKVAKEYDKEGLKVTYHNHNIEFVNFDGKTGLELIKDNSECCEFLLDTHWIQRGGADICDTIEKFADRISIIHFKDMAVDPHEKITMEAIGSGNISWDKVIKQCEKVGITHVFVEQDDCNGENPFDCLKKSYDYLKKAGLE